MHNCDVLYSSLSFFCFVLVSKGKMCVEKVEIEGETESVDQQNMQKRDSVKISQAVC